MYRRLLVWYGIRSISVITFTKAVQNYRVAGLYSGIFIVHLQYHASKKEADNSILFYALSLLYMLCVAMISVDMAASVVREVSNNEHIFIQPWLLISCAEQYNLPHYHYSSHSIRLL